MSDLNISQKDIYSIFSERGVKFFIRIISGRIRGSVNSAKLFGKILKRSPFRMMTRIYLTTITTNIFWERF